MSTPYIIKNSLAPVGKGKPSFTLRRNKARSSDTITFNYSKGNPSNAGDVHDPIEFDCEHAEGTIVTASGRVDDDVAITAPGINRAGGTQGSARNFNETGSSVPPGIYKVRVVHNNIENHPNGNVSILTGTLGPCPRADVQ